MIITIAHSKGGVGKSLLAWHLSIAMGVPIVDLDFQKTLVYVNKLREMHGREAINIIHPENTEAFIGLYDSWTQDKDIIIDVGGFDSDLNRTAIYVSDIVITPAVDRVTEMAGLYKFHSVLEDISQSVGAKIKTYVLLNDVSPVSREFSVIKDMITHLGHFDLLESIVAHRADFYRSMEEGRGVTEGIETKASNEILALVAEIKRIGKELE
ncbi:MAG: ParA family protein [Arcobacteraceae bacterium]|jgi:chromosome partitioning protein|nr:ParA family protein [Arcobacteraceae bacterium]